MTDAFTLTAFQMTPDGSVELRMVSDPPAWELVVSEPGDDDAPAPRWTHRYEADPDGSRLAHDDFLMFARNGLNHFEASLDRASVLPE